jgi:hypothetical protein
MVDTPSQTDTYNTALDIFDRTHPLRVDADENLKVTIEGPITLAATPTIDIGIVTLLPSTDAVGSEAEVFVTKTELLQSRADRKGLVISINSVPIHIWLGTAQVPAYNMPPQSVLEIENYTGSVFGTTDSGSTIILVTEKI